MADDHSAEEGMLCIYYIHILKAELGFLCFSSFKNKTSPSF